MMIDHLSLYTSHYEAAERFYDAALAPLGYQRTVTMVATWDAEFPTRRVAAYGPPGKRVLWLTEITGRAAPAHVAFVAPSKSSVGAFFEAALAAGGRDNGGPGPREQYHPTYYGAFVLDPDGHNVEAVSHGG